MCGTLSGTAPVLNFQLYSPVLPCESSGGIFSDILELVSMHTSGKMKMFSHVNYIRKWSS